MNKSESFDDILKRLNGSQKPITPWAVDQFQHLKESSRYLFGRSEELRAAARVVWSSPYAIGDEPLGAFRAGNVRGFKSLLPNAFELLAGLSLETLVKAIALILGVDYLDKRIVKNRHDLSEITEGVGIALNQDERVILNLLTEAVIWSGRYPAPLKGATLDEWREKRKAMGTPSETPGVKRMRFREERELSFKNFDAIWARFAHCYKRAQSEIIER